MMVARRTPGPAYANLQGRKPREVWRGGASDAMGTWRLSCPSASTTFALWHELCEWAKKPFSAPVTSKSYALQKGHILQLVRYVPDGSLCTASAEQIFPRDSVQRNCFELALYTIRDHDCISNSIGSGIRNCPQCRCRLATFGALPTPSMIDRAIIMLNDHRFWGHASGPSSVREDAPIVPSIAGTAMPLAAAPYRASGLVRWHFSDLEFVLGDVR